MKKIDSWVIGTLVVIVGIGALFGAARAQDSMFQFLCLLCAVWALFVIIRLIGRDSERM